MMILQTNFLQGAGDVSVNRHEIKFDKAAEKKESFFHYQLLITDVAGLRELLESIVSLTAMMDRTEIFCRVLKACGDFLKKHLILFLVSIAVKSSQIVSQIN